MNDEYEGKDLEEAIGRAAADLRIPEHELHYEVLEQGRKGLLGLGTRNVRIRVMRPVEHLTDREILNGEEPAGARVEAVAEVPQPGDDEAAEASAGGAKASAGADSGAATKPGSGEGTRSRRPRRRRRSGRSRRSAKAGGAEAGQAAEGSEGREAAGGTAEGGSTSGEGTRAGKPRRRRRSGRSRRGGRSRGSDRQARPGGADDEARLDDAGFEETDDTPVEPLTGQPLEVQQTLEKILELSGLQLEVRPGVADSGVALRLGGEDRKKLKQRNGELLLALQLVLNRMARRAWPGVGRIQLSTNGDHRSRDSKLIELTHGAAAEVAETGRTKKLRPMNAYERRLVHLTIREYSGLTSSSDGNGAVKRVRISKVQNTISA